MTLVFHRAPTAEFLAFLPILRGMRAGGGVLTVIAPWSRAHLAGRLVGASPMDIEMFEFTRLHAEGGPTRVSPAVADLFARAQTIISFVSDGEDNWADNVRRLAPNATTCFVPSRPTDDWPGHITDYLANELHDRGLDITPRLPEPTTTNADAPVFIHPGSAAPAKCWPRQRYEQLIHALRDRRQRVRPVLGEVEFERWEPEALERWQATLDAEVCRTTDALATALAGARLVIGNEAAPVHLAAQLGVPTLTLFGPSRPANWAPQGPGASVLAPPDGPAKMDWLAVDPVVEAALAKLG